MQEANIKYLQVNATADLSSSALDNTGVLHKAVTLNGAIAAAPHLAGGLLKSKGATGEEVALATEGLMKGWAGATVTTVGFPVTVTTSGFIIACPSGSYAIGKAYAAAASGDLFPILADFSNLSYFID